MERANPGNAFMSDSELTKALVRKPSELGRKVPASALRLRASTSALTLAANSNVNRMLTASIDMDIAMPSEEVTEIAELYHTLYSRYERERILNLGNMYDELGRPENVITMLYCRRFFPLFENWLASCAAHGIDVKERLIVFTLDEVAQRSTQALGVKSYCFESAVYGEAGGSAGFGDRKFSRTMFYKNAVIHDLLKLGCNVLFQDVDLIWLKDPMDYFVATGSQHDIHFMHDGHNKIHRPLYANTGFIYARCTEASRALMETALRNSATIFDCGSHQLPLNRILAHFVLHNVLSVNVLPQTLFLNGHLFNLKTGLADIAREWRSEGIVVHYSWTADLLEKRKKIEAFGFNYMNSTRLLDALTPS